MSQGWTFSAEAFTPLGRSRGSPVDCKRNKRMDRIAERPSVKHQVTQIRQGSAESRQPAAQSAAIQRMMGD
jgi:hypothetical protein